jgi:hypothetical protein
MKADGAAKVASGHSLGTASPPREPWDLFGSMGQTQGDQVRPGRSLRSKCAAAEPRPVSGRAALAQHLRPALAAQRSRPCGRLQGLCRRWGLLALKPRQLRQVPERRFDSLTN